MIVDIRRGGGLAGEPDRARLSLDKVLDRDLPPSDGRVERKVGAGDSDRKESSSRIGRIVC